MTLHIDLTTNEEGLLLQMPNGDLHNCTEDTCDCAAAQFGNLCRHRLFIYAMGGFDELRKTIRSERRKQNRAAQLATNQQLTLEKDTNYHEHEHGVSKQVPQG